mgnify:CR=1 FL=1
MLQTKGVSRLHVTELEVRFQDEAQAAAPVPLMEPPPIPSEAVAAPEAAPEAQPPPEEAPTLEGLLNRLEEATDIGTYQRTAARLRGRSGTTIFPAAPGRASPTRCWR